MFRPQQDIRFICPRCGWSMLFHPSSDALIGAPCECPLCAYPALEMEAVQQTSLFATLKRNLQDIFKP